MSNEIYYLYKITNLVNGKLYIGVTANPKSRERQHLHEKPRKGKVSLIKNAALKYGPENFKFEIICIGEQAYIYDLERKAIESYDTVNSGYNLVPGGLGSLGKKVTKRSDDYECFVSGFWFPNKRTACEALNITNTNVFYRKRKQESLGNIKSEVKGNRSGYPVYFKGFWFNNINQASDVFGKTSTAILQAINNKKIEEDSRITSSHPKRVLVIDGNVFKDLEDAAEKLNISKYTLKSRFYIGTQGYSYQYIKE